LVRGPRRCTARRNALLTKVLPRFRRGGPRSSRRRAPEDYRPRRCARPRSSSSWRARRNPTLDIVDIAAVAAIAKAAGRGAPRVRQHVSRPPGQHSASRARRDCRVPQRDQVPVRALGRGSRGVLLRGPGDREPRVGSPARPWGSALGPFEAWLVTPRAPDAGPPDGAAQRQRPSRWRGYLAAHPKVAFVRYPGLPDHPGHDVGGPANEGFSEPCCTPELKGRRRDRAARR